MKRKYKIKINAGNGEYPKGTAKLITDKEGGYLWLGDQDGKCLGWIDERQLDAIAKAWLKKKGVK